jgi:hypothetical protein
VCGYARAIIKIHNIEASLIVDRRTTRVGVSGRLSVFVVPATTGKRSLFRGLVSLRRVYA